MMKIIAEHAAQTAQAWRSSSVLLRLNILLRDVQQQRTTASLINSGSATSG